MTLPKRTFPKLIWSLLLVGSTAAAADRPFSGTRTIQVGEVSVSIEGRPEGGYAVTGRGSDGERLWRTRLPSLCSAHAAEGSLVLNLCGEVAALDPFTGRQRWAANFQSETGSTSEVWVPRSDTVAVAYSVSGALTTDRTTGLDSRTGKERWTVSGLAVYRGAKTVLFREGGSAVARFSWNPIFYRLDLATGRDETLEFEVQPRPGCGEEEDRYDIEGGWRPPKDRADATFVYLTRKDLCGEFQVKFRWVK